MIKFAILDSTNIVRQVLRVPDTYTVMKVADNVRCLALDKYDGVNFLRDADSAAEIELAAKKNEIARSLSQAATMSELVIKVDEAKADLA